MGPRFSRGGYSQAPHAKCILYIGEMFCCAFCRILHAWRNVSLGTPCVGGVRSMGSTPPTLQDMSLLRLIKTNKSSLAHSLARMFPFIFITTSHPSSTRVSKCQKTPVFFSIKSYKIKCFFAPRVYPKPWSYLFP